MPPPPLRTPDRSTPTPNFVRGWGMKKQVNVYEVVDYAVEMTMNFKYTALNVGMATDLVFAIYRYTDRHAV